MEQTIRGGAGWACMELWVWGGFFMRGTSLMNMSPISDKSFHEQAKNDIWLLFVRWTAPRICERKNMSKGSSVVTWPPLTSLSSKSWWKPEHTIYLAEHA